MHPREEPRLIPIPPDDLEEWLALPIGLESDDPRVVVRRARPEDFERVWDCVDAAFGARRPRAAYEWLYRRNPYGRARAWISEERETGRLVKTGACFPWPMRRGREDLRGSLSGDAATVPDWQRKGLSAVRRRVRRSHPWHGSICTIAGPNEGSRIVSTKAGEADSILGPLRGGVALLRPDRLLASRGVAGGLASPAGAVIRAAQGLWRTLAFRHPRAGAGAGPADAERGLRFEPVARFTSDFDPVTEATMAFEGYWCPHNAEWLNWRYLDHPLESYAAFALLEDERLLGYTVLRIAGEEATLSELAIASRPASRARLLVARTLEVAREAGCSAVNFFAPPVWRHWGLLRRAGMIPYRTKNWFDASFKRDEQGSQDISNWQVTPGDRDYH